MPKGKLLAGKAGKESLLQQIEATYATWHNMPNGIPLQDARNHFLPFLVKRLLLARYRCVSGLKLQSQMLEPLAERRLGHTQ
jgi:hypothetical protein